MRGDLHTHTIYSDGCCEPERLFELAARSGLTHLAITDHDHLTDFFQEAEIAGRHGITPVHGVEVSTYDYERKRRVHILCYFPQDVPAVRKICEKTTDNRRRAGAEMAELVSKRYPITVADVEKNLGKSDCIFKQHIMLTLMQAGFATEMYGPLWHELFNFENGTCVRECIQPDVWETLERLREAGGICVMAHPFTYRSIDILKELTNAGLLDGIEVWQSKTTPEQEAFLEEFAGYHHLIKTGGSDFHGMFASKIAPIGKGSTPEESLEALFALREKKQKGIS